MMKGHLYHLNIEYKEDAKGNAVDALPLTFAVRNHDEIFKLVEAMKNKNILDENDATAFAVGIKLFGEVMLNNRDNALFQQFQPEFRRFMQALKKT